MSEREDLGHILMDTASDLRGYARQRYMVHAAVQATLEPSSGDVWQELDRSKRMPYLVQEKFDVNSPAALAAVVMGAVAYQAHLYGHRRSDLGFAEMWHGTDLALYAELGEIIASGINPKTDDAYVHIGIAEMQRIHEKRLQMEKVEETIVITGLNGVGKSTIIGALEIFLDECGIEATFGKFPTSGGDAFGKMNKEVLAGKTHVDPMAMQYLFLADALDKERKYTNAKIKPRLQIRDRQPVVDALVYGPESMQTALLATRNLFLGNNGVMWTIIIDRHPALALSAVKSRGNTERRVFERELEQMVDHLTRFAALANLPGTRWVNNDFLPSDKEVVRHSCTRVISSVISTGAIGRALKSQGHVASSEEGQKIAYDVLWAGKGSGIHW